MYKILILVPIFLMSACAHKYGEVTRQVASENEMVEMVKEKIDFNNKIIQDFKLGQEWPKNSHDIAIRFTGRKIDSAYGRITFNASPDTYNEAHYEIITEGLEDDSIEGVQVVLVMKKSSSGYWQIASASKAWKCARSDNKEFTKQTCR
jgi:hypothetical protein